MDAKLCPSHVLSSNPSVADGRRLRLPLAPFRPPQRCRDSALLVSVRVSYTKGQAVFSLVLFFWSTHWIACTMFLVASGRGSTYFASAVFIHRSGGDAADAAVLSCCGNAATWPRRRRCDAAA